MGAPVQCLAEGAGELVWWADIMSIVICRWLGYNECNVGAFYVDDRDI